VCIPAVLQRWRFVSFLHWPADPDTILAKLPRGLVPDLWDGSAWVGVTPFSTTCEVLGVRGLPGPERFPETNVRTYVRAPDGTRGIWFFSLDVSNRANVILGRAGRLPYFASDMSVSVDADGGTSGSVAYGGRRRGSDEVGYHIVTVPGAPVADDPFASYLTDRWRAYVAFGPALLRVDVAHEPWPLCEGDVVDFEQTLTCAAGLDVGVEPPVVHYAAHADARLGWARPVLDI
jgi:uncharacterized protein YqjF (DUF2071 family)